MKNFSFVESWTCSWKLETQPRWLSIMLWWGHILIFRWYFVCQVWFIQFKYSMHTKWKLDWIGNCVTGRQVKETGTQLHCQCMEKKKKKMFYLILKHISLLSFFISDSFSNNREEKLGYPDLCHNWLDCFCFVLNLIWVEQNWLLFCAWIF